MSLFYPFWQQPRSAMPHPANSSGEYLASGRLVLPQPGTTLLIEFCPKPSARGVSALLYSGRLRVLGLRRLSVESVKPVAEGGPPVEEVAAAGMTATLSFVHADVLYRFQTAVAANSPLWRQASSLILARPKSVERIQRRRFYRVPIETATSFYSVSGNEASQLATGRIVNLSAGGLFLAANRAMPAGTKVIIRVPVGRDGFPVDILAESLECAPAPGRAVRYLIRFSFDNGGDVKIPKDDQEGIEHYLFEQQRMMLRVRKLMRGKA